MANVAKVAIEWAAVIVVPQDDNNVHTIDVVTTFHVMSADGAPVITADDHDEIIFHVLAWWESDNGGFVEVKSAYHEDLRLTAVSVQNVEPSLGAPTRLDLTVPSGGTSATRTLAAPQCAFVLGLRTTLDTRRGRGRMYLPAWDPNDSNLRTSGWMTDENQTDVGHIGAHLAYEIRSVWADGDEDGPFVLAVYSRVDGLARPVTYFKVPDRVATQRRRCIKPAAYVHVGLSGEPE